MGSYYTYVILFNSLDCPHGNWNDHAYSGLPWWFSGKESACQSRRHELDPWVMKIPWRRKWKLKYSLVFQWLGLWASTTEGVRSIPGQETKIPHGA